MKKISIIALIACAFFTMSCESDALLEDTRIADVSLPTVSFDVTVNKYDANFTFSSTAGNPEAREIGVMVSTNSQPTPENSESYVADENNTAMASLSPGTTYYACAYALTANKLITSEVKSFTTESHPLGAFLGKKTMTAYNLFYEDYVDMPVTISPDPEDETVAYLTGLGSEQVAMELGEIKLVFDVENNEVVIPNGQVIPESKYGNYRWVVLDQTVNPVVGDNVGVAEDGVISFESLAAMIVAGGNSGLFHWACFEIAIH